MNFFESAKNLSLPAAEKSAVKNATDRIAKAQALSNPFAGESQLHQTASPTANKIAELAEKFKASPSAELAAEIAEQTILLANLQAVANQFGGINTQLRHEVSRSLEPLAKELTARTIAELDSQLKSAVDGLEKIGGLPDTITELRAKHQRQVEIGNYDCGELAESHRDCLQWLTSAFSFA